MTAVSGEFRREIDAIGEVFAFLEAFVDGQVIDEKTAFCINLVAEELFTNPKEERTREFLKAVLEG